MNETLLRVGYIISLILGIIELIFLVIFTIITFRIGIIITIVPIIGFILFYKFYHDGINLLEKDPSDAKTKLLVSSIISLVFVSRIGGIIMLIGVLVD